MPVLDTSVLIDKIRRGEVIQENITEITVLEYPPVLKYPKFYGRIYYLKRSDLNLALKIQINLRKIGAQKSIRRPSNRLNLHKQKRRADNKGQRLLRHSGSI